MLILGAAMIENASCLNKSSVLFIFTLYAGTVWYVLSTQAVESTFYDILCLFSLFVVTPVFIQKYYFVLNKLVNNKYLIWCVLACFVVIVTPQRLCHVAHSEFVTSDKATLS